MNIWQHLEWQTNNGATCSFGNIYSATYRSTAVAVILDGAICVLFEGLALTAAAVSAETTGLMVITLERYFKIVHAIAHRKYYRNWMTSPGVAVPWIAGVCLVLFPGIGTTRIVNGQCVKLGVWPNEALAKVSLHLVFSCRMNTICYVHGVC